MCVHNIIIFIIMFLCSCQSVLYVLAVARGPARSYRTDRLNTDHAVLGGESIIAQSIRTKETMHRIEKAAKKGEEFVFDSKEKVDAVFRCTACYRAIPYLSQRIVGRFEIGRPKTFDRVTARDSIRKVVKNLCVDAEQISKDPPIKEGCIDFVADNIENLIDLLLLRSDPEDELFESDLPASICRDPEEIDTRTCPPGTPSMGDLLQNRFQEQDLVEEDEKKKERKIEDKKRKRKKKKKKKKKRRVVKRKRRVNIGL
jgi:hypothetical protein